MPKLWLFDLDDTLFEASGGMLHKIHLLMNEYMCRELGMEWEEASALRRHYWSVYGATFLGLWRHHGIDPRDFLSLRTILIRVSTSNSVDVPQRT